MHTSDLAFLCRAGFERDLCDELGAWYAAVGSPPADICAPQPAVVRVRGALRIPLLTDLVYARDLIVVHSELPALGVKDRLTPLTAALQALQPISAVTLLAPDSDDTRPLAPLLTALGARLQALATSTGAPAAVWLLSGTHALVGRPPGSGGAAFPGGIPRLRFPREAPSRSTLKLEEAFHVLLTPREQSSLLRPGGSGVDLGAAPGGWTYQLVQRGLKVTAIDNGRMDARLLDSGRVNHLREDGFRYRPPKPVDWLVCDMVEKPDRVADLIARWFREGWCRAAIFNLKLPMKRRFEAWQQARSLLAPVISRGYALRARQLYHDREEITVAVVPTSAVAAPAKNRVIAADAAPATRQRPASSRPISQAKPTASPRPSRAQPASGKAPRPVKHAKPAPTGKPSRGGSVRADKAPPRSVANRPSKTKSAPSRKR